MLHRLVDVRVYKGDKGTSCDISKAVAAAIQCYRRVRNVGDDMTSFCHNAMQFCHVPALFGMTLYVFAMSTATVYARADRFGTAAAYLPHQ